MAKTKMRCNTCGKWFQSANAKDLTCPDCMQKARKEKLAAKSAPPTPTKSTSVQNTPPPPPKPKQVQSGTNQWLDSVSDVKVGQPDAPTRPKIPSSPTPRETRSGPGGPNIYREDRGPSGYREREGGNRGPGGYQEEYRTPGPYHGGGSGLSGNLVPRPRQPMEGGFGRGPRPGGGGEQRPDRAPRQGGPKEGKFAGKPKARAPKPPTPPKPKREKIPPPQPFTPTLEQITQVETRYLELAVPNEYDGIRTQIAHELGIPKTGVKKIIKNLRDSQHIPSWWDLQTYKGSEEDLEKVRAAYEPLLPLPPVGVHKKIAEELSLKPVEVYQAIKAIRTQMNLPQYNDPVLHGLEPQPATEAQPQEQTSSQAEAAPVPTDAIDATDTGGVVTELQEEAKPENVPTENKVETDKSVTTEA